MIYFVQAGENGAIKIGTAKNVESRLGKMRVDCPHPLMLLAVIEGNADYEQRLHKQFKEYGQRGEWFSPSQELLAFIETLPKPEATPARRYKNGDHPLRKYRCTHGISLIQMAETVGTSHCTLSRFESGKQIPSITLMRRLVKATRGDVSLTDLIETIPEKTA
jgi:DNA-binding XRE family transcriptional regulator